MSNALIPITNWPGLTWTLTREVIWADGDGGGAIVHTSSSGFEVRLQQWAMPKYIYSLDISSMHNYADSTTRSLELQQLIGFINSRYGQYDSFLLDDWVTPDNQAIAQFIGNGDGSKTVWQLQRSIGGFSEYVYALNNTGDPTKHWIQPAVFHNGTMYTGGSSDWSMDANTGLLTLVNPPGAGVAITATFAYYWRVRFEDQSITVGTADVPQFWETKALKMRTCRQ